MTFSKAQSRQLLELAQLYSKFNFLVEKTQKLQRIIEQVEGSKAFKVRATLLKIAKRIGFYQLFQRSKSLLQSKFSQLRHWITTLRFLKAAVTFGKFMVQHGATFSSLLISNRGLFLLYLSNYLARRDEISIKLSPAQHVHATNLVDIIIPWYGDSNIVKLLTSLKTFDRKFVGQVMVINDAFPDGTKTSELFQQLKQLNFAKLKIITNSRNLGFVGTVNRGMKLSKNDVVLLNSDTIPTNNWIDELRLACYSNKKIATATALSNNATIFSVQKFNEPTEDSYPGETAVALATLAPTNTITVPTAHGFCMYIRRSILNKFGYFDQRRYGKGYCEENDFSMRLHRTGYVNVAATKSYVVHLEGRSFGSKKRLEHIARNYRKLLERYPEYHGLVHAMLKQGQLRDFQKAMSYLLEERKKNKTYILLINHSDIFSAVGGVERTTFEEINRLDKRGNKNILLYFYDEEQGCFKLMFIEGKVVKKVLAFDKNSKATTIFSWIVTALNIKLVIANHLMEHSLSYFGLLKKKQISNICFVHDYHYLFGNPDLLELGEFVRPKSARILSKTLKKHHATQLAAAEIVIFNSEFTKEIYEHFLGKMPNALVSYPDKLIN